MAKDSYQRGGACSNVQCQCGANTSCNALCVFEAMLRTNGSTHKAGSVRGNEQLLQHAHQGYAWCMCVCVCVCVCVWVGAW